MNNKYFSLLNYEGDVLKMIKEGENVYAIFDQWNEIVTDLSRSELFQFLEGDITITDSKGNVWNWESAHRDAKPSLEKIFTYVNTPVSNYTNPSDEGHIDSPQDWLNSALIFARALSLTLEENEGIVVDIVGDMDAGEDVDQVIVFSQDEQIRVIPSDRPDFREGDFITIISYNEN